MSISKDLFLSMDAYNRGYDEGVEGIAPTLGDAHFRMESEIEEQGPERQASFYAISYTAGTGVDGLAQGTKVISCRGTDAAPVRLPSISRLRSTCLENAGHDLKPQPVHAGKKRFEVCG